jgi:hypothetical protein
MEKRCKVKVRWFDRLGSVMMKTVDEKRMMGVKKAMVW